MSLFCSGQRNPEVNPLKAVLCYFFFMLYHVWWFNPLLWVVLSTHPLIIVAIPIAWQTNQPTPENCLWKPIDISMVSWFVCYPLLPTVSNNHHRWRYLRRYYMFVILSPVYLHSKKTDWWFGTMEFYDFPYIGNFIIPTSIFFQRGRYTTNQDRCFQISFPLTNIFQDC